MGSRSDGGRERGRVGRGARGWGGERRDGRKEAEGGMEGPEERGGGERHVHGVRGKYRVLYWHEFINLFFVFVGHNGGSSPSDSGLALASHQGEKGRVKSWLVGAGLKSLMLLANFCCIGACARA